MVAATWSCSFGPNASYVRVAVDGDVGAVDRGVDCRLLFGAASSHRVHEDGCVAVVLDELVRKVAVPRDAAVDARVGDLQQHGAGVGGAFDYDALSFRRVAG